MRTTRIWQPPGQVRRKGNAQDVVLWQTGTARLLPRLIGKRKKGPLLLIPQGPRRLAAADLDPETGRARLSYRRAPNSTTYRHSDG